MTRHLLLACLAAAITMVWGGLWLASPVRADIFSGWSVRDPHNICVQLACNELWRNPQVGTMHDYATWSVLAVVMYSTCRRCSCCCRPAARDTPMCSTT